MSSSVTKEIADQLARDVMKQMQETGDEDLAREVSKVLASTSVPTEEAFNSAIRAFTADDRARAVLAKRRSGDI